MNVNEGGIAAASFSLVVVIIRSLRDNHLATKQEIIDLFDAALLIIENSASAFPTDVQRSARGILAEMQDAFASSNARSSRCQSSASGPGS
jgi:hypothetical protein